MTIRLSILAALILSAIPARAVIILTSGSAPTTDYFGEIAADNNAWAASRGAVQFFDGTANTYLLGVLASDTPTNGQVAVWNTGGTLTWEDNGVFDEAGSYTLTGGWDFSGVSSFVLPTIATMDVTTINATTIQFEGTTADAFETSLAVVDPTADRTWTFPNVSDTVVGLDATQELTNKTLVDPIVWNDDVSEGVLSILEDGTNGSHRVSITVPASLAATWFLTLPPDNGNASQYLKTDGVGVTTWADLDGEMLTNDTVDDDSIDFGTGADQVGAVDIPIDDIGTIITATEVEAALQEIATRSLKQRTIGITVDGAGSVLTTGSKGFLRAPITGTIVGWSLIANASGNIEFDVEKAAANTIPSSSIVSTFPPILTADQIEYSTTLTGWTTSVTAGEIIEFEITGTPATITRATLQLVIQP